MLLRTTCSFHGNEERLVVEWAVFEQVTVDKVIDHSCSKTAHTDSRPV